MTTKRNLTQPQRLVALLIDVVIVAAACWYLFGTPYPPPGPSGFWAYSALLSVIVGAKLNTPFFVKPADAIAYAVPAFVSLMLVNEWNLWGPNEQWLYVIGAAWSGLIAVLGILNILLNALRDEWAKDRSNELRTLLDLIARPGLIYAPLIFFALWAYHRNSWQEAVVILIVAILTVVGSAGDFVVGLIARLGRLARRGDIVAAGQVVAFQDPGIILLRQDMEGDIGRNEVLFVADKHSLGKIAVALDYVGRAEGALLRAVELKAITRKSRDMIGSTSVEEYAYRLDGELLNSVSTEEGLSKERLSSIVGLVAADSTVDRLYFEVIEGADLKTGLLVSAAVSNQKVLYQIIAGLTREEVVQQKNMFGFLRAQAQQVGVWDEEAKKFSPCVWLPSLNAPVFLEKVDAYQIEAGSIGHFPGANLHARIESVEELVTHNTAILGILGIGKSCLAFEIVERLVAAGVKVICLDLTDEYKDALKEFCYDPSGDQLFKDLVGETGAGGKKKVTKNVEEGGSKPTFSQKLDAYIDRFITQELDQKLLVFNPAQFEVWRQDSKPFQNEASMVSLSPTEITQLFTEAALKACHKLGKVEKGKARVCLVFEEAHSLVPEWNAVVSEGDRAAVNGTARAILQGRKFGLGCLLVTQRTANVTKTILNQCNTVFAMRTFDETGKEFLSNYIGKNYTEALSSIPERHAVFFGRASSCENPVLIRLNDTEVFRQAFRAIHPLPQEAKPDVVAEGSLGRQRW